MVVKCCIIGCTNRKDREKDLHYYRLPAVVKNQGDECENLSSERRRAWLAKMGQSFENKNIDNVRICSAHFTSGKKSELYDRLNPDWAPTINLRGQTTTSTDDTPNSRFQRQKIRVQRKLDLVQCFPIEEEEEEQEAANSELQEATFEGAVAAETQTVTTGRHIEKMQREIKTLREEISRLQTVKVDKFSEEDFKDNDEKVKMLTGLSSYDTLLVLLEYLAPFLPPCVSLSQFRMLTMTLVRLRQNTSVALLAYQFGVSVSTVSRIFNSVIDVMFARMKPFIHWPDRDTLRKTMPMQFRTNFGKKVVSIIDCFEVFIERPSSIEAAAETYSSYKHHHTVKFLIGITPQGSVSFISKSWGGRTSDKYITEHCGYLNRILPGDLILADRGFDISASVGSMAAKVNIPAFTKGRDQLAPANLESTRRLANVRIHVERIIGTIRQKYSFLNGTVPISVIKLKDENNYTMIDKIALVCCALVNMNEPMIDFN